MDQKFTPEEHRAWTIRHDYVHEVIEGGPDWSQLIGKYKDTSCKRCYPVKKLDEQSHAWKKFDTLKRKLKITSFTQTTVDSTIGSR